MRFITLTYLNEKFSVNVERIAAIRDYNHLAISEVEGLHLVFRRRRRLHGLQRDA